MQKKKWKEEYKKEKRELGRLEEKKREREKQKGSCFKRGLKDEALLSSLMVVDGEVIVEFRVDALVIVVMEVMEVMVIKDVVMAVRGLKVIRAWSR